MVRKFMFVTDADGKSREVKVDPAHLGRQIRDHRAAGREVTVLTEDERIQAGLNAAWIAEQHRAGRI
ncbi:hypothetical protein O7626_19410 [Micromonospora sp. WMMD1102]|uniref:hypothetical protein n=1 Tax=Micromonospora sp. WMMD1102 TaxID=3016105 RepID=UPI0024152A5D|nr:hypothetical protein [Micromonospora sp. WMMD1102]MDG4788082.1 hypothetical protein [Micromonospora sp. WMMD1102]